MSPVALDVGLFERVQSHRIGRGPCLKEYGPIALNVTCLCKRSPRCGPIVDELS